MFTTTLTILTTLLALTNAVPAPASTGSASSDELATFRLLPSSSAPAEITSLGSLEWSGLYDSSASGHLGWFNSPTEKTLEAFIQYNKKTGITFYSKDTALQVYLHGTDAMLGNPTFVTDGGEVVVSFSVGNTTEGEVFGTAQGYELWSACGVEGNRTLAFGDVEGCSEKFSLSVVYD